MKYRIITKLYNDSIWYYVQQRECLFYWKTLYETTYSDDAKKIYLNLVDLQNLDQKLCISRIETNYRPKPSDYC